MVSKFNLVLALHFSYQISRISVLSCQDSDSIPYLGFSNYCRVESGKMSQVGQSGSQTHINTFFFQVTIVTIILVKMKAEQIVSEFRKEFQTRLTERKIHPA